MGVWADRLFERLEAGILDPRWNKVAELSDLQKWIAFHDQDRRVLRSLHPGGWSDDRPYKADPLPSRVSGAFADYLWGTDPEITPSKGDKDDRDQLQNLVEENDMQQTFWDMADLASAEGEIYWCWRVDQTVQDTPILDYHSRAMTVPIFVGKRLAAVAFISEVNQDDEDNVWRYVEVHEEGEVHNRLYKEQGSPGQETYQFTGIGRDMQDLSLAPETEGLVEHWEHGLPILAGRIPNRLGRDKRLGQSDYHLAEDFFWDLNETHAVDTENYAVAGQKRVSLPERYANEDGNTKLRGEQIIYRKEGTDEMLDGDDQTLQVLEYTYDGASSIARKEDLTATALTRTGLSRQFVDPNANEGQAASGTALRVRMVPTTLAARGKSRRWDTAAPHILHLGMMLESLPPERGGFDRKYTKPDELPRVARGEILPEDAVELYNRVSNAVATGVMSLETGLKELHPRWSDREIKVEADAIRADQGLPTLNGDLGNAGDAEDTEGAPPTGRGEPPRLETGDE